MLLYQILWVKPQIANGDLAGDKKEPVAEGETPRHLLDNVDSWWMGERRYNSETDHLQVQRWDGKKWVDVGTSKRHLTEIHRVIEGLGGQSAAS